MKSFFKKTASKYAFQMKSFYLAILSRLLCLIKSHMVKMWNIPMIHKCPTEQSGSHGGENGQEGSHQAFNSYS